MFSSVFKNEYSEIRHQQVVNEDFENDDFMESMYQDAHEERKAFVEADETIESKEVLKASSAARVSEHLRVEASPRKGGKQNHT